MIQKKIKLRRSNKTLKSLTLYRLVPSIVTIIALCVGLTSLRYAFDLKWEQSLLLLIFAAFLDGMDGRIARYLNVTSDFGAQLDSLADFVNFGVVPAVNIYIWILSGILIKGVGWGFVLVYVVCMALRLARFNSMMNEKHEWQNQYFLGVPAPFGAILIILPMMLSIDFPELTFLSNPWIVGPYMLLIAFALASRIPTFAIKQLHISKENVTIVLALFGFIIASLVISPWLTISVLCLIYICSIPISAYCFYKKYRKATL
jgi:CDP-diacylglycerol--serine O-phosphatidyltransferase